MSTIVRAQRAVRLLVVLSREEVAALLSRLDGPVWLMASHYGLKPRRLAEALKLVEEHANEFRHAWSEHFPSFADLPWFREAAIGALTNVQLPSPHHLYWPDLDIDLAVESIEHPEKYPLVSQAQPNKALQPTSRAAEGMRAGARPARLTAERHHVSRTCATRRR